MIRPRSKMTIVAAAAAVLAGGGAAVAATQFSSAKQDRQAVLNDVAKRLGIQPSKLDNAFRQSLEAQVDAAVKAGKLTKQQGAQLKARIESGNYPLFGPGGPGLRGGFRGGFGHRGFGPGRGLESAAIAKYLGLSAAQLGTDLRSGKSLAQIATAQKKSVAGLEALILANLKAQLAKDVTAKRITQAQADQFLARSKQKIAAEVNETHVRGARRGFGGPFGGPDGPGGGVPGGPGTSPGGGAGAGGPLAPSNGQST